MWRVLLDTLGIGSKDFALEFRGNRNILNSQILDPDLSETT